MAVGSAFAAMNTMYAAVARRGKEIGTLRILGFTKGSILLSFFLESLLLSLFGGILACLLVLPLNTVTTGLGNFVTFSETSFKIRIGPGLMAIGLLFSLLLGAVGGLLPARQAAQEGDSGSTARGLTRQNEVALEVLYMETELKRLRIDRDARRTQEPKPIRKMLAWPPSLVFWRSALQSLTSS